MRSPPPVNPKVTVVERKIKRWECRAKVRDLKDYKDIQHLSSSKEEKTSKGDEEEATLSHTQKSNGNKTKNEELRVVPLALIPGRVTRVRSRLIQRTNLVKGDKNVNQLNIKFMAMCLIQFSIYCP